MAGALDGVRVIEIGDRMASAYAGKLLRDLGAEVIKVEPPEGDGLRRYGPFPSDRPDPEHSGMFVYLHGGKRGAVLDMAAEGGREALDRLLRDADVLLHCYRPSEATRLGLAPERVAAIAPRCIVAAVTTFGSTGPAAEWVGYPLHAYMGSGVGYRIGEPDRAPLNAPLDGADLQHAAPQVALSVLLALLDRDRTGRGQFVDISVTEAVNVSVWGHGIARVAYGRHPMIPRGGRRLASRIWGVWSVADGDYIIQTQMERHWHAFLKLLGDPEWSQDERVRGIGLPAHMRGLAPDDHAEVMSRIERHVGAWLRSRTKAEIWKQMREQRISFHPVLTVPQVCESDQMAERGGLVEAPGPHPALRVPGPPYRMAGTPWQRPGPPPCLDAPPATGWIASPTAEANPPAGDPDGDGPLAGVRVLDLGQVWAGPLVGRYLADYGADVVHIRTASRPPTTPGSTDPADPEAWEWIYRNRRSLALDFRRPEAVGLFRRLCEVADVVIDNFAPRVMPRLGLDYDELVQANPRLIMVALPPAGRTGPWADLVTYGPSLAALFGLKSLNGYPEDQRVVEDATDLDPVASSYATLATLAALHSRARSGRGQLIEVAQGEAGFAGIAEAVIEHEWNQRDLGPVGNTHRVLAPHGVYPCVGEDQWIAIACGSDEEWRSLATAAGHPEWLDRPAFATPSARRESRGTLDAELAAWSGDHDKSQLASTLQRVGVAAYPVIDQLEAITDPQLAHRRRHFVLHDDFAPEELLNGNPWHLSAAPPRLRRPAPALGAHNAEVLGEYLGMSPADVRSLEASGVLA